MNDVVDLSQRRLEKVVKESGAPVLGGPVPPDGRVVSVLGCSNCGSAEFRLAHNEPTTGKPLNAVICAQCCVMIGSLRWFDVNLGPPAPAEPA